MSDASTTIPFAARKTEDVPGHWLLARLGKRVLRPGGLELTRKLLDRAGVGGANVVELAPGLGRTATEIIARSPAPTSASRRTRMPPHSPPVWSGLPVTWSRRMPRRPGALRHPPTS